MLLLELAAGDFALQTNVRGLSHSTALVQTYPQIHHPLVLGENVIHELVQACFKQECVWRIGPFIGHPLADWLIVKTFLQAIRVGFGKATDAQAHSDWLCMLFFIV